MLNRNPLSACQSAVTPKRPGREPALHPRLAWAGAERRTAEAGDFVSRGIRRRRRGKSSAVAVAGLAGRARRQ